MNFNTRFEKTALASAVLVAIGLGLPHEVAALTTTGNNFSMVTPSAAVQGGTNDVTATWDQTCNTSASSTNFNMTLSSPTTFSGFVWTAHHVRVFGPGTYTINTACTAVQVGAGTCTPSGTASDYNFTVAPGKLGAHMLFDWNTSSNIDVVLVWNQGSTYPASMFWNGPTTTADAWSGNTATVWDLMSSDADGDSVNGRQMIDGPFAGFNANFNIKGLTPLANNAACGTDIDVTPNPAPSFTAVTNATLSTLYPALETYTVAGLGVTQTIPNPAQTASISITNGQYRVSTDGGTTWSGWSPAAPITVANGDKVQVQATSSASNSTTVNAALTIGGASGTFSITTVAGAVAASGSNFTMINPNGGVTGGTNDVAATWDGNFNTGVTDTNFDNHMSISSSNPFSGFRWTAHHLRVFGPGGPYVINIDCTTAQWDAGTCTPNGNPTRNYSFTVGAGQVGAHMLFDWNTSSNIDVVEIWNQTAKFGPSPMYTGPAACNSSATIWDLMSSDWDGDGKNGGAMIDGPFAGFAANFNIRLSGTPLACSGYTPTVNVSDPSNMPGCSISTRPSNGIERGDWWLVAGFLAWLGGIRIRLKRKSLS